MKELCLFEVGDGDQFLLSATGGVCRPQMELAGHRSARSDPSRPPLVAGRPPMVVGRPKVSKKFKICRYFAPAVFQMLQLSLNQIFQPKACIFLCIEAISLIFQGQKVWEPLSIILSLQISLSLELLCLEALHTSNFNLSTLNQSGSSLG